ncbi:MAG: cyclic nucleotide-binding domain-containing protein [Desulfobacteraceae bacterium]|nr:MAG: cyclic nucleotide-binding domain-containing protein [Desulfobacteraceae bacterium]
MVSIETLEQTDVFKDFSTDELSKILEICSIQEYSVEDRLFAEGDMAKDMWVVLEGQVDLRFEMPRSGTTTRRNTVSTHDREAPQSQVFGWSCFIPPYKMRLSAYCSSRRCQVLRVEAAKLNQLMDAEPAIGYKTMQYLLQVVGYRFKQMQDELARFKGINMMNSW